MKISDVQSWLVEILKKPPIAPYQTRFRAGTSKQSVIFRVETDKDIIGRGEMPQNWIGGDSYDGTEGAQTS